MANGDLRQTHLNQRTACPRLAVIARSVGEPGLATESSIFILFHFCSIGEGERHKDRICDQPRCLAAHLTPRADFLVLPQPPCRRSERNEVSRKRMHGGTSGNDETDLSRREQGRSLMVQASLTGSTPESKLSRFGFDFFHVPH